MTILSLKRCRRKSSPSSHSNILDSSKTTLHTLQVRQVHFTIDNSLSLQAREVLLTMDIYKLGKFILQLSSTLLYKLGKFILQLSSTLLYKLGKLIYNWQQLSLQARQVHFTTDNNITLQARQVYFTMDSGSHWQLGNVRGSSWPVDIRTQEYDGKPNKLYFTSGVRVHEHWWPK